MTTERAERMWAWVVEEPDGSEGIISAYLPGSGHMPLVTSQERNAHRLEQVARQHNERTGKPVRLNVYRRDDVSTELRWRSAVTEIRDQYPDNPLAHEVCDRIVDLVVRWSDEKPDDLDLYYAEQMKDPEFRKAYEAAEARARLFPPDDR